MSLSTTMRVWDHSAAKGTELLMLLAIANFANPEGENAFPGIETLARMARVSTRQAHAVVTRLVERGELTIKRRGGGRGIRTVYGISLRKPDLSNTINKLADPATHKTVAGNSVAENSVISQQNPEAENTKTLKPDVERTLYDPKEEPSEDPSDREQLHFDTAEPKSSERDKARPVVDL